MDGTHVHAHLNSLPLLHIELYQPAFSLCVVACQPLFRLLPLRPRCVSCLCQICSLRLGTFLFYSHLHLQHLSGPLSILIFLLKLPSLRLRHIFLLQPGSVPFLSSQLIHCFHDLLCPIYQCNMSHLWLFFEVVC